MFSGSGGIGIEAISRGADRAYFVENSRNAVKVIKDNLEHTHFTDRSEVIAYDAISAIRMLETRHGAFDVIFMDPPYNCLYEKAVLEYLKDSTLIHEDTLLVVEASLETSFDYLDEMGYNLVKHKCYKTNAHAFIRKA